VTSAAAVMIAVFAIFAPLRTLGIKQMGVGLAVAVLLDATLIRGVLLNFESGAESSEAKPPKSAALPEPS